LKGVNGFGGKRSFLFWWLFVLMFAALAIFPPNNNFVLLELTFGFFFGFALFLGLEQKL
jgi:hypothetical protein